jgi:hypothetical protein
MTSTAISVIGLDIYVVTDRTVGQCRLQCCRMAITICQRLMKLFLPIWQHHRLMIVSTIAPMANEFDRWGGPVWDSKPKTRCFFAPMHSS